MKGYPRPSLQWFFEGNAISNESENYMISGSGDQYHLTILKVTADMEGEFQCKATNQYGSRTASARLKVVSTTTIGKFYVVFIFVYFDFLRQLRLQLFEAIS